jgi:hypothetical protein
LNFHIDDCVEELVLFFLGGEPGVRGILSKHLVYIHTCASYASTPYPELLKNIDKQKRGLVGHSNAG